MIGFSVHIVGATQRRGVSSRANGHMVGWLGRLDTFASQCSSLPIAQARARSISRLSVFRTASILLSLLYYVRAQGVVYADIMALGRGRKRDRDTERERKRGREGRRGKQRSMEKRAAGGEKKVLQLSVSMGVLLFTGRPLNRVQQG